MLRDMRCVGAVRAVRTYSLHEIWGSALKQSIVVEIL